MAGGRIALLRVYEGAGEMAGKWGLATLPSPSRVRRGVGAGEKTGKLGLATLPSPSRVRRRVDFGVSETGATLLSELDGMNDEADGDSCGTCSEDPGSPEIVGLDDAVAVEFSSSRDPSR